TLTFKIPSCLQLAKLELIYKYLIVNAGTHRGAPLQFHNSACFRLVHGCFPVVFLQLGLFPRMIKREAASFGAIFMHNHEM
ncbi:MAG: hypothetical protein NC204_04845, partial [Candidatus Amulumruptor caecigallinarius]|nr:hypothetical protein [Candidatus Amulumruptor caecigallinarius]